ncbi:MAG: NfeD family protein [Hyphomicrobiaceae bacterium]
MWLIAAASIIAPVAGVILCFIGFAMLARGEAGSGWWIGGGGALIVLDYLTDIWLHRVSRDACEEPQLNARGAKYIGRLVVIEQPIEAGRGRVRIGDSWWSVEGPDLDAGARVRIIAARGAVLIVAPE